VYANSNLSSIIAYATSQFPKHVTDPQINPKINPRTKFVPQMTTHTTQKQTQHATGDGLVQKKNVPADEDRVLEKNSTSKGRQSRDDKNNS